MKDFLFGQIHVHNILNPCDLFFWGVELQGYGSNLPKYGTPSWVPAAPPKFNIALEKWWLEDYCLIGKVTFQGLC